MKGCHGDAAKDCVCGHVTDNWLNCCYAQALYTKGHLTSIAGSNCRSIQLNLSAILSAGQAGAAATARPRTSTTPLLLMTEHSA